MSLFGIPEEALATWNILLRRCFLEASNWLKEYPKLNWFVKLCSRSRLNPPTWFCFTSLDVKEGKEVRFKAKKVLVFAHEIVTALTAYCPELAFQMWLQCVSVADRWDANETDPSEHTFCVIYTYSLSTSSQMQLSSHSVWIHDPSVCGLWGRAGKRLQGTTIFTTGTKILFSA